LAIDDSKLDVVTAGMIVCDIIAAGIERFAEPGEMLFIPDSTGVRTGGHPLNVALDLAQLGNEPKKIGVIAAVGNDFMGDFLEKSIVSKEINSFLQRNSHETSKNMIFVKKGEDRRFHIDPGANLYLEASHVKKILSEYNPKVFCCRPGYSGIDLEMESIYKQAKNSLIMLDVCRPYNKQWSYLDNAIKYVDVFHGNYGEAMNLTGKNSLEESIKTLLGFGIKILLITGGDHGAEIITNNYKIKQPGFKINTIDPSGAGDAFCSGFITKYLQNAFKSADEIKSEKASEILLYAQAAGACSASAVGCSTGVSKGKVEILISEQ